MNGAVITAEPELDMRLALAQRHSTEGLRLYPSSGSTSERSIVNSPSVPERVT